MMKKNILIACYEVPGYGGASTSSYKLFEKMQAQGCNVSYVSLISVDDADHFKYIFGENIGNPKKLKNVFNCYLGRPIFYPNPTHTEVVELLEEISPDFIVGVDFIASVIMKREAPRIPMLFLTCGCAQAGEYIKNGIVSNAIELSNLISNTNGNTYYFPKLFRSQEAEAVASSELVVVHSELNMQFFKYFYPQHRGKIYPEVIWFADWICEEAHQYSYLRKPFSQRDIDVLFVSSIWSRKVKNYSLMKEIAMKKNDLNIHIVGEVEEQIDNMQYHGYITQRQEIFKLLGRSKTVVSTSNLDAAPGLLFEASAMGCNIVSSKNCGNSQICNKNLLLKEYSVNDYIDKIEISLTKKYEDNVDYFLDSNSYRNLVDIISVM